MINTTNKGQPQPTMDNQQQRWINHQYNQQQQQLVNTTLVLPLNNKGSTIVVFTNGLSLDWVAPCSPIE
jgi:hypothetical protein